MKHFERLLVKRNPRTIETLKEDLELRLRSRMTPRAEKAVPMIRCLVKKAEEYNQQRAQQNEARLHGNSTDKHIKHSRTISESYDSFVPARGALIDMHGPGTVFYRIRQQHEAKAKRQQRHKGKGVYSGFGASVGSHTASHSSNYASPSNQASRSDATKVTPHTRGVDRETSDPTLSKLESRMRAWLVDESHKVAGSENGNLAHMVPTSRSQPRIEKLHRGPEVGHIEQLLPPPSSSSYYYCCCCYFCYATYSILLP